MIRRKIVLASKSPRRKQLLEQIGLKFEIKESEYEEDMQANKDPIELAKFLAFKKAEEVAKNYDDSIVIGADCFIIYQGKSVGKPKNKAEAKEMLKQFSGKEHKVVTGFAIVDTKTDKVIKDCGEAKVKFKELNDKEINDYIATGEPLDKAGAYGIHNRGAVLIESISGDYYSVVGLPLNKIYLALQKLGVDIFQE